VEIIANLLQDCCVSIVWGTDLTNAIRDVIVEIIRNAFIHGNASNCRLSVQKHAIHVEDNGADYDWLGLPIASSGRGGAAAVKHLIRDFADRIILGSKRAASENHTTIALAHSLADVSLIDPCSRRIAPAEMQHIKEGKLVPSWFGSDMSQCR